MSYPAQEEGLVNMIIVFSTTITAFVNGEDDEDDVVMLKALEQLSII